MNKLIQFPILILKRRRKGTICNNIKKHHHKKRSLPKSKFKRKSIFQTRSVTRKEISKQWLQIFKGRRVKLTKMMKLGAFLFL
jgi:hypothetical protein